jgi:hypothetical protein
MLKRLVVGLLLGAIVGVVVAVLLAQGLGITSFAQGGLGAAGAYLAAAVTGVLIGLVAGKPIWSADGKIEAGLKAFFGALLALGGMFALRQWVNVNVDLPMLKGASGPVGQLPAASLPIIAALLGGFFELDNTDDGAAAGDNGKTGKSKPSAKKVRVAGDETSDSADDEDEVVSTKKRRN